MIVFAPSTPVRFWYLATLTPLMILLLGLVPSLITSDWAWFTRSGALFVLLGVALAWYEIPSVREVNAKLPRLTLSITRDAVTIVKYLAEFHEDHSRRLNRLENFVSENRVENSDTLKISEPDFDHGLLFKTITNIEKNHNDILSVAETNEQMSVPYSGTRRLVEIFYIVLGTLIWAYGDLFDRLIDNECLC